MTSIFISHSSDDNAAAQELAARLNDWGHRSVFLDVDAESGIAAGARWEQELYAAMRSTRAVIFLSSPSALASKWVFAELTHARSLGKPIFPVVVAPAPPDRAFSMFADVQSVDLGDPSAMDRLRRGLKAAGLEDAFEWDGSRDPYPGLRAFQESDAALFFGRTDDIHAGLGKLAQMRGSGGERLMLFVGASGSGKSSLVRAGLVPRLRRDRDNWIVVGPFRSAEGLGDPYENLAESLAAAFGSESGRSAADLRQALVAAADPHPLVRVARDLAIHHGQREASALVIVDQLEELLGGPAGDGGAPFLGWLLDAVRQSQQITSCPLVVLATVRSDFVPALQAVPDLLEVEQDQYMVRPVARDRFGELIEGPARLVGLDLEPGLTSRIIEEAATEHALPLIAFTMSQLWKRHGQDGALTLAEYESLGGLAGSVRAVVARVLEESTWNADVEEALRRSFVLHLVEVNDAGQHRRRTARRADLPGVAIPMLERFVDARLLVKGDADDTYEIAHESLFAVWDQLATWLELDREFLSWRRRVGSDLDEWLTHDRDEGALLRGAALVAAQRWLDERRADLDEREREFLDASVALRARETAERAEQARMLHRRQQAAEALALTLGAEACIVDDAQASLILGIEAAERSLEAEEQVIPRVGSLLRRAVLATTPRITGDALGDSVESVSWSPDGACIATGSSSGILALIDAESHDVRYRFAAEGRVESITWSPDASRVAAGAGHAVRVWDASSGALVDEIMFSHAVQSVDWRPGSNEIAVGLAKGQQSVVEVHDLGRAAGERLRFDAPGIRGAWSRDGRLLATGGFAGGLRIFDADGGDIAELPGHSRYVHSIRWTSDSERIATASVDDTVLVWDAAAPERIATLAAEFALGVAWSPDDQMLAAGSGSELVQVWDGNSYELIFTLTGADTITGQPIFDSGAQGYVVALDWSPDGRWLAASDRGSSGGGGQVHLLSREMITAREWADWLAVARSQRRSLAQPARGSGVAATM